MSFFTYEGSLRKWDEAGILDREISVYKNLIKHGVKVAFLLMATRMIISIGQGWRTLKSFRFTQL